MSYSSSGRESHFKTDVRSRDGKCVLTGIVNNSAPANLWRGFHAAHVFPLASGNHCSSINSCQNGLLLSANVHEMFDDYSISVNPDVSDSI